MNTLEKLSELEHVQWTTWTRYMLDVLMLGRSRAAFYAVLPEDAPEKIERWERQIETPYAELTEAEKESHREWARKVLLAVERFPGDDVITMDEWQWVVQTMDEYPDEWSEEQWVEFNERGEAYFGLEKWGEFREIVDEFLAGEDGDDQP